MADLPTPDELAAIGRAAFRIAIDPDGTGAVDLRAGSRNDVAVSTLAAVGTRLARYAADRVAAARRASARGADLDDIARDLYHEERKADAAATGGIRLTRPGTTPTTIPKGSRFGVPATANAPAILFEASADVASATTAALVPLVAQATGTAGNLSGPGAITAILDPLPDSTWTLDTGYSDPPTSTFGGGAAAETDDELNARLDQLEPQDSGGTRSAILKAALAVPGVFYATAIEPLDGTVILYAGDVNYALPAALQGAIEAALLEWRAFGVPVLVRAYNTSAVQVTAAVYMSRALREYDLVALRAAMVARLLSYFATRAQPDEYFLDAIEAAVHKADPEVQHVVLAAPLADVKRPADTGYGAVTALNRYTCDAAHVALTFLPPLTT